MSILAEYQVAAVMNRVASNFANGFHLIQVTFIHQLAF